MRRSLVALMRLMRRWSGVCPGIHLVTSLSQDPTTTPREKIRFLQSAYCIIMNVFICKVQPKRDQLWKLTQLCWMTINFHKILSCCSWEETKSITELHKCRGKLYACQNRLYIQTTKWFERFKFADDVKCLHIYFPVTHINRVEKCALLLVWYSVNHFRTFINIH